VPLLQTLSTLYRRFPLGHYPQLTLPQNSVGFITITRCSHTCLLSDQQVHVTKRSLAKSCQRVHSIATGGLCRPMEAQWSDKFYRSAWKLLGERTFSHFGVGRPAKAEAHDPVLTSTTRSESVLTTVLMLELIRTAYASQFRNFFLCLEPRQTSTNRAPTVTCHRATNFLQNATGDNSKIATLLNILPGSATLATATLPISSSTPGTDVRDLEVEHDVV
jgi:hypothetical protein